MGLQRVGYDWETNTYLYLSTWQVFEPSDRDTTSRNLSYTCPTHTRSMSWMEGFFCFTLANSLNGHQQGDWFNDDMCGAFLVAQWWRICLPMQEMQSLSLAREDPTCCGATKPACCNFWARALQLLKPAPPRACVPPQWEAPALQRRIAPAPRN